MGKKVNEWNVDELYREDCIEAYKQYESVDEFKEACFEGIEGGEKIYRWGEGWFDDEQIERIWKDGEAYMLYI